MTTVGIERVSDVHSPAPLPRDFAGDTARESEPGMFTSLVLRDQEHGRALEEPHDEQIEQRRHSQREREAATELTAVR